eukprot:38295-Rhodomonas_salina.4
MVRRFACVSCCSDDDDDDRTESYSMSPESGLTSAWLVVRGQVLTNCQVLPAAPVHILGEMSCTEHACGATRSFTWRANARTEPSSCEQKPRSFNPKPRT